MNKISINKPEQIQISLARRIISIFLGLALIGIGFYLGVIPIFQILILVFKGEPAFGNFGILAFSIPLVPLGFWVLFSTLRRQ